MWRLQLTQFAVVTWFHLLLDRGLAGNIQGVALNNTLTIAYSIPWSHEWEVGPTMGSAIIVAIEEVKRRELLPGYDIDFVFRDSYCKGRRGMQMAVDMWASVEDLDFVLGDGCSVVCQPISLLAAAWGVPVVSYACASEYLSDKSMYPTFSRVSGPWSQLGPMFDSMADMMSWKTVGIITTNEDVMRMTAEATKAAMESSGKTVYFRLIETTVSGNVVNEENLQKQEKVIKEMRGKVSSIFVITYANDVRNVLISALDAGMLNGGYAFIGIDCAYLLDLTFTYRPEADSLIYGGLIIVRNRRTTGAVWDNFADDVIKAFQDPRFDGWPHLPITATADQVEPNAGYVNP